MTGTASPLTSDLASDVDLKLTARLILYAHRDGPVKLCGGCRTASAICDRVVWAYEQLGSSAGTGALQPPGRVTGEDRVA